MHYLGSKAKHADQILKHVLAARKPGQLYVEPFVGGGNVLCRVPQSQGPRLAADYNAFMVALLKRLSEGWTPPMFVDRPAYEALRDKFDTNPNQFLGDEDAMARVAIIAIGASFGSTWFGSWASDNPGKEGTRWRQSRAAAIKDTPGLVGARFVCAAYEKLEQVAADAGCPITPGSLFYCDPPYWGTSGYDGAKQTIEVGEDPGKNRWSAVTFWQWADSLVDRGHTVFVSEYSGPRAETYDVPVPDALREARQEAGRLQRAIIQAEAASDLNPDGTVNYLVETGSDNSVELRNQLDTVAAIADNYEIGIRVARQAKADRWTVVWDKAVTVNIAGYVPGAATGKKELLLTRSPE